MLCPACLTDNPDTAVSCTFCGNPLGASQGGSTPVSPLQLAPGTTLHQGTYTIQSTLGQGGFGITYQALDRNQQSVAIKELLPEKCARKNNVIIWPSQITPQQRNQQIAEVKREADFLQKCAHPNIVKVYGSFEENNTAYIVMAMAQGDPLSKLLRQQKKMPESKVTHYFIQVGEALKAIHAQDLLHRDINPNNIIVDPQDRVTLIDFGNAREFIAGQSKDMTRTITPGYAPLEQYSTRAKRGPATDFYAVCATMYELLTGELPPEPTDRMQVDPLKPPRQLEPSISALVNDIILSGLKIRAEDRFQTADELIQALQGKFVPPKLQLARSFVNQGKLPEAMQAYEDYLASNANQANAVVELALVLIHRNDARTEAIAQRATQLSPKDGRGFGVLGLVACRRGQWQEAVKHLRQAAQLASTEAWIQANLAWALGMTHQWAAADRAVEQALQLDPQLPFALGLKAWLAAQQQQWKVAIQACRRSITQSRQRNPQGTAQLQSWVYPCLTLALYEGLSNKRAPDLEHCLKEVTTQSPSQAFAWGFSAWLQAQEGRWADALQTLEVAQQRRNPSTWVYHNLGIVQERQSSAAIAAQYYETLHLKNRDDAFVLYRLGSLLGQRQQWEQARSYLERAIQLQPENAAAHHNLGWVLLNLHQQAPSGKLVRAVFSAYRQAIALYSQQQRQDLADSITQEFQRCNIDL